jgi:hypothetical protein
LTDAALRILGKELHALTHLDISHAKSISDVGIATLTKGCKALRTLKCHGAFLLADPRFYADSIMNHIPGTSNQINEDDYDIKNFLPSNTKTMDRSTTLLSSKSTGALPLESSTIQEGMTMNTTNLLGNTYDQSVKGGNTGGGRLEAWEEAIGIVAMVANCPELTSLDISGCFRIMIQSTIHPH